MKILLIKKLRDMISLLGRERSLIAVGFNANIPSTTLVSLMEMSILPQLHYHYLMNLDQKPERKEKITMKLTAFVVRAK